MVGEAGSLYRIPVRALVLLSFLGYVLLAYAFPLLPNFDLQPVGDIRTFAPDLIDGLLYGLLLLILFALHALLCRSIRTAADISLIRVIGAAGLLALPLLFMYPINANDVYRYVLRGLISSRFGKSPFVYAPADFGAELYPLLAGEWRDATSPYGPIWELLASAVTSVGQDNLLISIIMLKLVGLLSLTGAGVILWLLFTKRESGHKNVRNRALTYTVLWMLNPALLLTFVGNAHNDALMILFLLMGWLIIEHGYDGPGFLFMMAAALIKPVALLSLPIVFVACWRFLQGSCSRLQFLLWSVGGGLALTYLAFLPFGNPSALIIRLFQEASTAASFSPLTLIILLTREMGWNASFRVMTGLATFLFVVFFIWLLWRTWRARTTENSLALVFWGYPFQALNFRIWYAVWPLPWLLQDAYNGTRKAGYLLHAGLWFLVTSQLSVILYSHIRLFAFGGSHLLAHLVGVPFVFLSPFGLAWLTSPRSRVPEK